MLAVTDLDSSYCSDCQCIDPEITDTTETNNPMLAYWLLPMILYEAENTGCEFPFWVGDDFCDDGNNNSNCFFDGGDCCGDNVIAIFCDLCECIQ